MLYDITCPYVRSTNNRTHGNVGQIGGCQRQGVRDREKWVKVVKKYKHPAIRQGSSRNVMCSMVTTVDHTGLCDWKLLRE